ncbi:hypothetical protein ACFFIX_00455 [Metabacillus herbersteinensis]|uniref:Uncharacterized protein n=1 Tax=Metabacillus herbersteinensis TaxID=283816 RepID=A0ABV6G8F7_9BACI
MYKKHCNRCFQPSFSSYAGGEWICPICTNDLTTRKAVIASNRTDLTSNYAKYQDQKEVSCKKNSSVSYQA